MFDLGTSFGASVERDPDALAIEAAIIALGREPGGGLCRHGGRVHGRASRVDHIAGGPKQRTGGLCAI
jgi:hypothetical protein